MEKFLLVGNPNTGKTTLFNALTKSNEHVGNWHGVTVGEKTKLIKLGESKAEIVDLPGLYSLTPLSFEEEVAADIIYESADKIINICDINNLKRNLYLTLQLLEVNKDIFLFINTMTKKINKNKINNTEKILNKLKINYFIGNPNNKKDINLFKNKLLEKNKKINLNYLNNINLENNKYKNLIKNLPEDKRLYANIRAIEEDVLFFNKYFKEKVSVKIESVKTEFIEEKYNKYYNDKNTQNISFERLVLKRQAYLDELFKDVEQNRKVYGSSKLDKILLNKYLCLPIFFGILFLIFYLTFFSVGAFFSNLLRTLIQDIIGTSFIGWLKTFVSASWVIDLFEVGIIGGVGSLLAFLPQIIFLFFFLSLIEDSGYLSRVAFMFEDLFSKFGLSGKSVYTLLMGFGCSTTAALTSRNMEDKNAKIKTAMLTPYMSCSAKFPIYAVIGGAFFLKSNIFVIFGLYLLGVVVALTLSYFLEKTKLKSKEQSFILEFPEYRLPSLKRVLLILLENVKVFLIRIGTLLISMNVIVWLLQSFSFKFEYVKLTAGAVSMLESMGNIIAPIFIPLGFGNWGAASALLAGLIAKEVIVSSIAMFNGVDIFAENMNDQTMTTLTLATSAVCFTQSSALSFLVFCLLYSPCLATISVFRKEIGKKWTYISIVLQLIIAYVVSFLVYRIALVFENFNILNILFVFIAFLTIIASIISILLKIKKKKFCSSCNNCFSCKNKKIKHKHCNNS